MSRPVPIALPSVQRIEADGVSVFYREAGPEEGSVLLLLRGFPASSFEYRELMLLLADRYRVKPEGHTLDTALMRRPGTWTFNWTCFWMMPTT